jgi:transposase
MMIIGCDFHPRFEQIAFVDQETGEYGERRLCHPGEAEQFYRSLAGRHVRIGAEATGNFRWFRRLMDELGHEFLLGDAAAIRASCPRKQKTDKRDARHILKMLVEDRFPAVWQPAAENEELRQLLLHRCRMVRMRVRVKNQLDSMAKNEGLLSSRVWSPRRRQQIETLPLPGWYALRRKDLFVLLDELDKQIRPLDESVRKAAEDNQEAGLLMTHPGVGPIVSLAYVLTIGD